MLLAITSQVADDPREADKEGGGGGVKHPDICLLKPGLRRDSNLGYRSGQRKSAKLIWKQCKNPSKIRKTIFFLLLLNTFHNIDSEIIKYLLEYFFKWVSTDRFWGPDHRSYLQLFDLTNLINYSSPKFSLILKFKLVYFQRLFYEYRRSTF